MPEGDVSYMERNLKMIKTMKLRSMSVAAWGALGCAVFAGGCTRQEHIDVNQSAPAPAPQAADQQPEGVVVSRRRRRSSWKFSRLRRPHRSYGLAGTGTGTARDTTGRRVITPLRRRPMWSGWRLVMTPIRMASAIRRGNGRRRARNNHSFFGTQDSNA
jgi:hypothetical protein